MIETTKITDPTLLSKINPASSIVSAPKAKKAKVLVIFNTKDPKSDKATQPDSPLSATVQQPLSKLCLGSKSPVEDPALSKFCKNSLAHQKIKDGAALSESLSLEDLKCFNHPDFDKDLNILITEAKKLNSMAQLNLGKYIFFCCSTITNSEVCQNTLHYLSYSACFLPESVYVMGLIYHQGSHVQKNNYAAYLLFRCASRRKHIPAMYMLATYYLLGVYVEPDNDKPHQLFEQAKRLGCSESTKTYQDFEKMLNAYSESDSSSDKCFDSNDGSSDESSDESDTSSEPVSTSSSTCSSAASSPKESDKGLPFIRKSSVQLQPDPSPIPQNVGNSNTSAGVKKEIVSSTYIYDEEEIAFIKRARFLEKNTQIENSEEIRNINEQITASFQKQNELAAHGDINAKINVGILGLYCPLFQAPIMHQYCYLGFKYLYEVIQSKSFPPVAKFFMGELYAKEGAGIFSNEFLAILIYQDAVRDAVPKAMFKMGFLYYHGFGEFCKKDLELAVHLLKKAAACHVATDLSKEILIQHKNKKELQKGADLLQKITSFPVTQFNNKSSLKRKFSKSSTSSVPSINQPSAPTPLSPKDKSPTQESYEAATKEAMGNVLLISQTSKDPVLASKAIHMLHFYQTSLLRAKFKNANPKSLEDLSPYSLTAINPTYKNASSSVTTLPTPTVRSRGIHLKPHKGSLSP